MSSENATHPGQMMAYAVTLQPLKATYSHETLAPSADLICRKALAHTTTLTFLYRLLIPRGPIRCFRNTDLDHARLHWRVQAILPLCRALPRVTTSRTGGKIIISIEYQRPLVGSAGAGAGAKRTYVAAQGRGRSRLRAGATIASRYIQELGERSAKRSESTHATRLKFEELCMRV
eukprot:5864710-Pleurochrysis_carterae.AAC.4